MFALGQCNYPVVGAQADQPLAGAAFQRADDGRAADALGHVEAELVQLCRNECKGALLLEAKFRMIAGGRDAGQDFKLLPPAAAPTSSVLLPLRGFPELAKETWPDTIGFSLAVHCTTDITINITGLTSASQLAATDFVFT